MQLKQPQKRDFLENGDKVECPYVIAYIDNGFSRRLCIFLPWIKAVRSAHACCLYKHWQNVVVVVVLGFYVSPTAMVIRRWGKMEKYNDSRRSQVS